ncbi:hypothetical protein E3N88_02177 [Mikania micrantha]|uniref:Coatomer subunit zeta n=1 Tax=Mikania micrantha TaxID=192012 RepID=A0A5N6Q513_9ASTR|nr:hypothetical protein E3N88_02177 [Mikania micrantha]
MWRQLSCFVYLKLQNCFVICYWELLFEVSCVRSCNRVAVKYYSDDWQTNSSKEAFEKAVFTKTQKTNARAEEQRCRLQVFSRSSLFCYRGDDENELIISTVLQGFFDAIGLLLRGNVDKKEALENLDLILLCLDEIVDGGIILETDANVIAGKVATHSIDSGAPLSEQTISQALATAREHLTRSLLKSCIRSTFEPEQAHAQSKTDQTYELCCDYAMLETHPPNCQLPLSKHNITGDPVLTREPISTGKVT